MAIGDDFTLDYTAKTIRHTSGATVYAVNALYSWLMDVFDELAALDDEVPMSAQTPTAYTLINGWFLDNESAKYLSGGAIATIGHDGATYADGVRLLTFAAGGYVNAVAGDLGLPAVGGTTGDSGILLAYDNTLRRWWVRTDALGDAFDVAEAITITGGTGAGTTSGASTTGESLWANIYTLGSIESGTAIYVAQNGSVLTSWWTAGHLDILVKVKEAGAEIDSGVIYVFAREWGDTFDWFSADLTAGGRTAIPLATQADLNNTTLEATVAAYGITVSFGSYTADKSGDGVNENYAVQIDLTSTYTLAQAYEYLKYITRRTAAGLLNGVEGQQYRYANAAYTPVKAAPFGTFAGGKFFGARGIYIVNYLAADANNFQLIDADGNTINPPTTVALAINSVVSGDRVAMFRLSGAGGTIVTNEYTLNGIHAIGAGTVVVNEAIKADTPASGVIRIEGYRYAYASYVAATKTFTLTGTLAEQHASGATCYVPFVDEQASSTSVSKSVTYPSADVPVLVRVRRKGILPFEVEGTITSSGLTVTAIRTTDSIVTL